MVFVDSKTTCKNAALHLLQPYKSTRIERFRNGKLWGMVCTDAAGMGLDITNAQSAIQYGIERLDMTDMWQRYGRVGRNRSMQAACILFVEDKYYPKVEKHKRGDDDDDEDAIAPREEKRAHEQDPDPEAESSHDNDDPMDIDIPAPVSGPPEESQDGAEAVGDDVPAELQFIQPFLSPPLPRDTSRQKYKKAAKKGYVPGSSEEELSTALNQWCIAAHAAHRPRMRHGPTALLSDAVILRLKLIAHHRCISTPEQLLHETDWLLSTKYGSEIIAILKDKFPDPKAAPALTDSTNQTSRKREINCSTCKARNRPSAGHASKCCPP
ncbi:hypothetical protein AURDEDRAFT_161681 [Auricularia subglabra TFB-10046 SS5]|nr:hypothetical protein AURDEDRAFT_161681 [Auricularia subglabra TFB-10046 SS5]